MNLVPLLLRYSKFHKRSINMTQLWNILSCICNIWSAIFDIRIGLIEAAKPMKHFGYVARL